MAEILSQEEIDSLLQTVKVKEPKSSDAGETSKSYDFRHPRRISSGQMKEFEVIHQNFSRDLSIHLMGILHTTVAVSVDNIVNQTYGEYTSGIFSPTYFLSFSGKPLEGFAAMNITMDAVFPMIDKMLGGIGEAIEEERELTEIEASIMNNITNLMCADISSSWSRILKFSALTEQKGFSTNIVTVTDSNEMVIVIIFDIAIGKSKGTFSICYPMVFLKLILNAMAISKMNIRKQYDEFRTKLIKIMHDVKVDINCDLPQEFISAKTILSLRAGNFLKTSFKTDDFANISFNGTYKMTGRIMSEDTKKGVKISKLIGEETT